MDTSKLQYNHIFNNIVVNIQLNNTTRLLLLALIIDANSDYFTKKTAI